MIPCGTVYLFCGVYIAGRYDCTIKKGPGIMLIPIFWPFVLAGRGLRLVWQRGNQHRFEDE